MKLKPYEKYKPSGIDWIKEIPEEWEVRRVKDISNVILGKMLDNKKAKTNFLKPYLKSKNITWQNVKLESVEQMYFSKYELKRYKLIKNDLLLSEGGEVGKTSFWNNELEECFIQNSVHKITILNNNYFKYFYYVSVSLGINKYYESVVNMVSIKHLTREKLIRIFWIKPPLQTQTKIANFLDQKTAQIDKKIKLLEQKLDKYEELKKALINETVCRGLDKTVELKESGVEWIGKIPKHWEVKRVKDFFIESKRKSILGNEDLLSVSEYTGVSRKIDSKSDEEFLSRAESLEGYKICNLGDLVINIMLAWKRGLGVSEYSGIVSPSYCVFCPLTRIESKYYHYLFRTDIAISEFKRNSKGIISSRLRLYSDSFLSLSSVFPPLSEQTQIADYLDEKSSKIDEIKATIKKEVDILKELRKTLINDVVTGKVKID